MIVIFIKIIVRPSKKEPVYGMVPTSSLHSLLKQYQFLAIIMPLEHKEDPRQVILKIPPPQW